MAPCIVQIADAGSTLQLPLLLSLSIEGGRFGFLYRERQEVLSQIGNRGKKVGRDSDDYAARA